MNINHSRRVHRTVIHCIREVLYQMTLFFPYKFSVAYLVYLILAKNILVLHGYKFDLIDFVKSTLRESRNRKFYPSYLLNE